MPTLEQMKIWQKMLADFGDFALRCNNLDDVLREASAGVGCAWH